MNNFNANVLILLNSQLFVRKYENLKTDCSNSRFGKRKKELMD